MNWVTCKQCQKQNTLDGQFCRRCGHALDEAELQAARSENEKLLTEGFKFLSDQRYDEAYETAKVVLEIDPSLGQAYSLMGDVLERKGDYNGALIAFEKVLQDNPGSTLDQIKLNHVRTLIQASAVVPTKPPMNKKRAVILAMATTLLVASLGAAAISFADRKKPSQPENLVVSNSPTGYIGFDGKPVDVDLNNVIKPDANNNIVAPGAKINEPAKQQPTPEANQTPNTQNQPEVNNPNRPLNQRPGNVKGELPSANATGLRPMNINVEPDETPPTTRPVGPGQPRQNDPDPTPATNPNPSTNNGNSNSGSAPGTTNQTGTKPVIDIRPSPNNSRPNTGGGTSQPVQPSGNSVRDIITEARKQYILGNFAEAAKNYEEALRRGAEAGTTNQRLGQCYDKLGKKSEARRCYERSVEVFERRISGGDTSSSTKASLEAARQALKAL